MENVAENSSTTVSEESVDTQQVDNQANVLTTPLDGAGQAEETTPAVTYDFKGSIPEGFEFSEANANAFIDVIKDMNLNNDQANAILKYGCDWAQGIVENAMGLVPQQLQEQADGWADEMKQSYGGNYDKALASAGQAIEYLERNGVPEIRQMLGLTGAGSRVEMMQLLNVVSKLIESDPGMGVKGGNDAGSSLSNFYNNSDFSKM